MHSTDTPELVFGLVGPVGVDMDAVQEELIRALKQVSYQSHVLHLTKLMVESFQSSSTLGSTSTYEEKIKAANKIREKSNKNEILAALAVMHIRKKRSEINKGINNEAPEGEDLGQIPLPRTAFIIRQLKRSEEIDLLKRVYGKRFIQLSISITKDSQALSLRNRKLREEPALSPAQRDEAVRKLISIDEAEMSDEFGQRSSDAFHSGDAFIPGDSIAEIRETTQRFVNALFGMNSISPTIDEFGSYMAKAASLRSIDLSRQVGAAIVSASGDLVSIGCNEVPKAGGGNYWCSDHGPHRDMDRKVEANRLETGRIIFDFLQTLQKIDIISRSPEDILSDSNFQREIRKSLVSDITEYGRMTHAEMSALMDAARLGRSVHACTIFVTTFPCHNCAKHIIASGINRIVFIEPYPKSRAVDLHDDSLSATPPHGEKVRIEHFKGISPKRYRDIFEKGKRRNKHGEVQTWYEGSPTPMIGDRFSSHVYLETGLIAGYASIFDDND